MRTPFAALFATLALAAALAAPAQADQLRPMTVAPAAQKTFEKTYGVREIAGLSAYLETSLRRELAARGLAGDTAFTIETLLLAAKPNHPTFQQISDNVALDYLRSFGLGGATLQARLIDPAGRVVKQVDFQWYESDLQMSATGAQWNDAEYAMRRFAKRVVDAYVAARAA